jgi:hypothetical protein
LRGCSVIGSAVVSGSQKREGKGKRIKVKGKRIEVGGTGPKARGKKVGGSLRLRFEVEGTPYYFRLATYGRNEVAGKDSMCCSAAVTQSKEKVILAMEERNKLYFFSSKTKYSSLVIPAVLRLFLITDTGTSS